MKGIRIHLSILAVAVLLFAAPVTTNEEGKTGQAVMFTGGEPSWQVR
ncbi:hypothetical protein [Paenibacillus apiarius]|uniref:Uncharacterized protein n=1 Tax=Paenibacillus apiarius TaxID=46240 RepID=A0ABT4DW04_9BACL|nr:hypothetical protein [Paenibacillus apiarius]MBN3526695.1 hypothetical protein [Paenibacillus apiarius]MCY9513118.1 hypothetical protein [Paenibacillus apiarius]MCY9521524.1 hypothetical protein [Paenibacillus apiarius]MCY9551678.1 hypothetical protein [Paenibacillus apiarius]MCY9560534.1 hypothetical protein [Paenibacillus apiarius]